MKMKILGLAVCFFVFLYGAIVLSSCKPQNQVLIEKDNSDLNELVLTDQEIRKNDTIDWEPIDNKHREVVMSLLANGLVRTNQDKLNAALILQHTALTFCNDKLTSISPENYLLAYQLSKSAFESGEESAAYMTAVTYDRYLLYTQGVQKYGTQRIFDEESEEEVWAPIDLSTSDDERAKFNVPPLDELLKKYKMK